jgi:hypothetical protein
MEQVPLVPSLVFPVVGGVDPAEQELDEPHLPVNEQETKGGSRWERRGSESAVEEGKREEEVK